MGQGSFLFMCFGFDQTIAVVVGIRRRGRFNLKNGRHHASVHTDW